MLQAEEPQYEEDQEKVIMQWQIVLEVAVAEREGRVKEVREDRDLCR